MVGSAELGYAVEQALRHRHPPVVFVDEAQHLARIASGHRLSDQLEVIKSIANRTETVHVLLGTYELMAFRNLSAQLSRRSVDLHFQRLSGGLCRRPAGISQRSPHVPETATVCQGRD